MRYNEFEKHVKEELSSAQEPVQMGALLAGLNLDEGKRTFFDVLRSKLAAWMIVPCLLVGGLLAYGATTLLDDDESHLQSSALENMSSNDQAEKKEQLNKMDHPSVEDKSSESQKHNDQIAAESTANPLNDTNNNNLEIKHNTTTTNHSRLNNENFLHATNTVQDNEEGNLKTEQTSAYQITEYTTQQSYDADGMSSENKTNSLYSKQQTNTNSSNLGYATPASHQAGRSTNDNLDFKSSNTSLTAESSLSNSVMNTVDTDKKMASLALLTMASSKLENDTPEDGLFKRMKVNCPSFDKAHWHLGLMPEVGIFMPHKYLDLKAGEPISSYENRKISEESLEGINVGLYGMVVRDDLPVFFKGGISYSRISEKMINNYSYMTADTTVGIISSSVSANGDTITNIYGDIITEITHEGTNVRHHYLHLVDIPLSVGMTAYIAGVDVSLEGGIKLNVMTKATGQLLTASNTNSNEDFTSLENTSLFKERIGISYFGGMMVGRNFGRFGDLYIAPRFTYYKNDFTTNNNPVSQRYVTFGINAGIVIRI